MEVSEQAQVRASVLRKMPRNPEISRARIRANVRARVRCRACSIGEAMP
jgi:hypothetical protein